MSLKIKIEVINIRKNEYKELNGLVIAYNQNKLGMILKQVLRKYFRKHPNNSIVKISQLFKEG
ncbi:MAG: hypothetical protein ACTSQJ_00515 [Promethearchaeota archaeon]